MTTEFEKFATDHALHHHCAGCGFCILVNPQAINPVWCVGCYNRIEESMPADAPRPWAGGVVFQQNTA